ncbi:MAG: hypothetical protein ACRC4P_04220, partial [Aeromonas sp.]
LNLKSHLIRYQSVFELLCVCVFVYLVVFHMYHYIIQVSSKPIPAFEVVIKQLRQQTSVTYLALANHHLLHYDVKQKQKCSILAPPVLAGWQLSSRTIAMQQSANREPLVAQLGKTAKAECPSCT